MSEDDSNGESPEDESSEPDPILGAHVATNDKKVLEDGDWEALSESDEE